ncbi:hypothetical protein SAMN04488137_0263 [Fictibacillus solisalsi]|uniref:Uncharacterized protein n=1 Tax=Fictibacillus solisalsi TaxID=459525 RepID=A0A1G9TFS1_9BACL|nr:hypothetical protein SAMN04488137_0263 [Fictibacillus solisalsi]
MKNCEELAERVKHLEKQLKEIQSHCSHVFFETSESDVRTCIKCSYTETVFYRFPQKQS